MQLASFLNPFAAIQLTKASLAKARYMLLVQYRVTTTHNTSEHSS
jgi:hypothetical protein